MPLSIDGRLSSLERKVAEHDGTIRGLRSSVHKLVECQEKQAVAVNELSVQFGQVARELSGLGSKVEDGKNEMISAMRNLSDHVGTLDVAHKSFRDEWKGVCEAKHDHVAYRLKRVESNNAQARREIDDMSENSKVQYIQDLQRQLELYEQRQTQETVQTREDKRAARGATYKLIGVIITSLLGGTGGTVLIQWLLGR